MTQDIKTALNDIKNDLFEIWKGQTETTLCNDLKDTAAKIDNLIAKLDLRVYTGGYWTAHDIMEQFKNFTEDDGDICYPTLATLTEPQWHALLLHCVEHDIHFHDHIDGTDFLLLDDEAEELF